MDIQKEEGDFNAWFNKQTINAVPDADLSLQRLWASLAWQAQAAKAQEVPENKKFNLDEFLEMEQKLDSKDGVITADLDRFIAYAEMVLEKAKALKEPK